MKKFTQWVEVIRQAELNEASELQKSYQDYFKSKLDKYGAKSPADLSEDEKKKFFEEISAGWEKGKGIKEGIVFETEIKNAEEFRKFAEDKLKKVHGDDFDQAKADKVIKGLSDEAEKSGDWGAAVGKLNKA